MYECSYFVAILNVAQYIFYDTNICYSYLYQEPLLSLKGEWFLVGEDHMLTYIPCI